MQYICVGWVGVSVHGWHDGLLLFNDFYIVLITHSHIAITRVITVVGMANSCKNSNGIYST